MQRTPLSLYLTFNIKSSCLIQRLRVGFDDGVKTGTLVVDLYNTRKIGLTKKEKTQGELVHNT